MREKGKRRSSGDIFWFGSHVSRAGRGGSSMAGDRGGIGCGGRGAGVDGSRHACSRRRGRVAGASRHLPRVAGAFRHPERAAREGLPRANRFVSDYRARTLTWAPVLTWETSAATPGVPAISYRERSVTRGFCGGGKGRKVNVGCARSGRIAHRSPEGFGEM